MRKILLSSFVALFLAIVYLGARIISLENADIETYAQASTGFEQCAGQGLAQYMNGVIEGTAGAGNVLLLSPAFNLTNEAEKSIFRAMVDSGADFGGLDGFAGNTYSNIPGNPASAYDHYQNGWADLFSAYGKRVVFTEFGDFKTGSAPIGAPTRGDLILQMKAEYNRTAGDGSVLGINYFNALGTNPDPNFAFHIHTDDELRQIASDNPGKLGVNSAVGVNSGFASRASQVGARWTVEIVNDAGGVFAAIEAANAAIERGINPVIRFCTAGSCGFSDDPQELVNFINDLGAGVNGNVWVIAGPNEPATEQWATPQCSSSPSFISNTNTARTPCHETTDPEFHSLRPYGGEESSPCNQNIEEIALLCGNDLIARKNYEVTPGEASSCQALPNGGQRCQFSVPTNIDIRIDLEEAELPIAGNTELVPNVLSNADDLSPSTRVNEYVSWYLNGVNSRAEEDYLSYNGPGDVSRRIEDVDTAADVNRVINFSGPVNKLLPWTIQIQKRVNAVEDAIATVNSGPGEPNIRHDQIVGCTIKIPVPLIPDLQIGTPIPCYNEKLVSTSILGQGVDIGAGAFIAKHRLSEWGEHIPPVESDYNNFGDYWLDYKEWRGRECKRIGIGALPGNPGFFLCFNDPTKLDFWGNMFHFIPLTNSKDELAFNQRGSTEDRKGFVSISPPSPVSQFEGNEVEIVDLTWTSESESDLLYFAHTMEDAGLADLLQDTYTPISERGGKAIGDIVSEPIPERCEIVNARSNPGDDLLGELAQFVPEEADVSGTIGFIANFECDFVPEFDQAFYDACLLDPTSAGVDPVLITTIGLEAACTAASTGFPATCQKQAFTSSQVTLGAPKTKEIWDRLVAGPMGVFRRIYPQIGKDSPVRELEAIPAETGANYLASSNDGLAGAVAGSPVLGRPGSQAKLFIPYVGGYEEYFLEGIQKALRPKGDGLDIGEFTEDTEILSDEINCVQNLPDSAVPAAGAFYIQEAFRDNVFRIADDWLGTTTHFARECYNDVITRSIRAGINPALSLAIWLHESDASNYAQLPPDVQDFGVNLGSIARNFDRQIEQYLALANGYPSRFPECYGDNGFSQMEIFTMIYKNGARGCEAWNKSDPASFAGKTTFLQGIFGPLGGASGPRVWQFIGCSQMPSSPTDFTCN